ncbi:hypothetical protein GDO86_008421 [Hymenochirus boettgeri]|uniref:11-beta-hydroxysteroid dehydrogenase type 2 n=1 Tax=Hymenochirus boettgeri TaxID=247094 RepID=A0A8T2J1Y4_9PIPI|nr:hypothetical protein GDO86_008421 [Hymenochirus boettgeri]
MELATNTSFWAYGAVWLTFIFLVYLKFSSANMALSPALVLYVVVLILTEWLCHLYLPISLGILLLSAACWYVLGIATVTSRRTLPVDGKVVFISGCDSGFGNAAAHKLDSMGFKVIATVMNLESVGAIELRKTCSERLIILQMDLTKPEDIKMAEQITRLHTSNTSGDHSFPYLAAYGASKAALSRVMDTFRFELMPWEVKVSIILPGSYKTGAYDKVSYWENQQKKLLSSLPTELLQEYGEEYITETQTQFLKFGETASTDYSAVIESITDAILSKNPKVKYYPGEYIWFLYLIGVYLPYWFSYRFTKFLFMKNKGIPRSLRKQQTN